MQTESKGQEALLVLANIAGKNMPHALENSLGNQKSKQVPPQVKPRRQSLTQNRQWVKRHAIYLWKLLTMSRRHTRISSKMLDMNGAMRHLCLLAMRSIVCLALHWFALIGQCCWLKVLISSLEGYFSVAALQLFLHGPLHLLQRQTNDLSDKTPPISWIHETRSW